MMDGIINEQDWDLSPTPLQLECESLRQQLAESDEFAQRTDDRWMALMGKYEQQLAQCKKERDSLAQGCKITVPTQTMEQEFSVCHRRGYEAGKKEIEQQLAECQAALKAKDEAINTIANLRSQDEEICTIIFNALAIQPDDSALREWGARLLESVLLAIQPEDSYQDDWFNAKAASYKTVETLAKQLRLGEWKLEI